MKRGDAFPSARLKAEDIKGHDVTVEIEDIKIEEIGQGEKKEKKPCVYFKGKEKSLVLNVTNWNMLEEELRSRDSDDWIGCRIVLSVRKVDFKGDRVDAIRVIGGEPREAKRRGRPEPVEDEPEPEVPQPFVAEDDDVPF